MISGISSLLSYNMLRSSAVRGVSRPSFVSGGNTQTSGVSGSPVTQEIQTIKPITGDRQPPLEGETAINAQLSVQEDTSSSQPGELSSEEQEQVDELKARDREVRAHEQAHKAAAGQYAGAIRYDYQTGPDGNRYAIGGSVSIDSSPIEGDPQETIRKMTTIIRAAKAPAEPSAQDLKVARQAQAAKREAQAELNAERQREAQERLGNDEVSTAGFEPAFDPLFDVGALSGEETGTTVSITA